MSARLGRRLGLGPLLVAGLLGAPAAGTPPCLRPPLSASVVDPFRAPVCPYCAGNRGIEFASVAGTPVVAAAAGRVTFAGRVAGITYVVLEHGGGYRTTYGRLTRAAVGVGDLVRSGDELGSAGEAVFFGLRAGEEYLDPQPHLAVVVARPQLVPLDGRNRRPARLGRLVCP